jgi:hypothetical protein
MEAVKQNGPNIQYIEANQTRADFPQIL